MKYPIQLYLSLLCFFLACCFVASYPLISLAFIAIMGLLVASTYIKK